MGEKRGHYRTFKEQRKINQRKQYAKNYKATEWKMKAVREETIGAKIASGRRMFVMVTYLEKCNHFIGEKITFKGVDGLVVGIYQHFLLVDCGNYKTTIRYTDLLMGGIEE